MVLEDQVLDIVARLTRLEAAIAGGGTNPPVDLTPVLNAVAQIQTDLTFVKTQFPAS